MSVTFRNHADALAYARSIAVESRTMMRCLNQHYTVHGFQCCDTPLCEICIEADRNTVSFTDLIESRPPQGDVTKEP